MANSQAGSFSFRIPLVHLFNFCENYTILHWLKAKKQIDFKLTVLVFKCVHGYAPPYLADELSRPADSLVRCKLCSASSSILVVCRTRLTTVGDRSFLVAASHVWNNLPQHVITSPSLRVFKNRLKTHFLLLFLNLYILFVKCLRGDFCHF